jgi:hypothetical protein
MKIVKNLQKLTKKKLVASDRSCEKGKRKLINWSCSIIRIIDENVHFSVSIFVCIIYSTKKKCETEKVLLKHYWQNIPSLHLTTTNRIIMTTITTKISRSTKIIKKTTMITMISLCSHHWSQNVPCVAAGRE